MHSTPTRSGDTFRRTALVTGGTDGIGLAVAERLACLGCSLIIAGRNAAKGAAAVESIRSVANHPHVRFEQADLSLMREAVRLADGILTAGVPLHYLVHSAGIVRGRRVLTAEGIESNFAVNYLSRVALSRCLLPLLEASACTGVPSRVLLVSGAAQGGRIYTDDVNLTRNFRTIRAILQFCQANDLFTVELADRLVRESRPHVTIACLKVGVVKTNIRREFPRWMKWLVPLVFDPLLGRPAAEIAESAVRILTDPACAEHGRVLFRHIRRFAPIAVSAEMQSPYARAELWALSERLIAESL